MNLPIWQFWPHPWQIGVHKFGHIWLQTGCLNFILKTKKQLTCKTCFYAIYALSVRSLDLLYCIVQFIVGILLLCVVLNKNVFFSFMIELKPVITA